MSSPSTPAPEVSPMIHESLESLMSGLGSLAVAGAIVAALFIFWDRLGVRPAMEGLHFPKFSLAVAIAAAFTISLVLDNWWFFVAALLALPGLYALRWAVGKILARRTA